MSRIHRRLATDDGVTVVELLVAITLVGIIGAITVTGLVRGMHTTRYSQDRVDALAATQTGLERMSREIRAADPLREKEEDRIALDVRRGGSLYHYQYEVQDAGGGLYELVQELWRFDDPDEFDAPGWSPAESDADRTSTSVLVSRLAGDEAFTYLDTNGADAASIEETRRVVVTVSRVVQDDVEPIEVETTVKVRNAD